MKTIYKFLIFILLFLPVKFLFSQQPDEKRISIEVSVKDGKNQIASVIKSYTISYNRTLITPENNKSGETKAFYISLDFEKQDIPLLKAFVQNKSGLDGQITITDTFGKLPARKIEFKSAVMDLMTDQTTGDYHGMFMNLSCNVLIIDGLKIEH
ncbi:hypothetical protein [Chryseobacterium sp. BIGb0232]|uniref:hypothetical protein n=1 Tax=Chryseobacterium sp. BIGb0232 TaxID=2940598 RepID=UPI000F4A1A39|nr:hypothetical protein [Chryseobacterium sp. BIGb0232]MCS4305618.1 hypothetical protein [Chryseobacterium sp. BIGb0232]ROS20770.1 hypothetical protein EDF65_1503 [Chryseobacterium nakagawai]